MDGRSERSLEAVLALALLTGLVIRLLAALTLGSHVDEGESVLAARMIAQGRGPILPSGLLFLQGLTLSSVLPLFDRAADPLDFSLLRLPNVLVGTASVWVTHRLAREFGAGPKAAVLAAFAMALDPSSVEWSALVRPYAALQLCTLGLLTLWMRAMKSPNLRATLGLSALFSFTVFTHVGVALILPAMGALTLLRHGRALLGERRDLLLSLASFAIPMAIFMGLNTIFGVSSSGPADGGPSFIGDHLLHLERALSPDLEPWRALYRDAATRPFMTYILVFGAAALILLRPEDKAVGALLWTYAAPVLFVTFFTSDAVSRYMLHIHPLGWIIVALAGEAMLDLGGAHAARWRALVATGALAVGVYLVDGVSVRLDTPFVDPSYPAAIRWVQGLHRPGQPVLLAMSSFGEFSSVPKSDLYFLAGDAEAARTTRYTRARLDGPLRDYWIGVPAIASAPGLCELLKREPESWIVLDDERLNRGSGVGKGTRALILGATARVRRAPDEASVYRPLPPGEWSAEAQAVCAAPG